MKLATDLLSAINTHQGISKANKFVVKNMAIPDDLKNDHSLNLRDMNFFCDSTFFPGRNMATVEYRAGSVSEPFIHSNNFAETITLTFNLTNDMFIKKLFDEWQDYIMPLTNKERLTRTNIMRYPNEYRGSFDLVKLDSELKESQISYNVISGSATTTNEGYTVQILDAFPKQVDAMNVSFASQEALKLTVQMAFSRWIMK